jgi:glycosyltransferase
MYQWDSIKRYPYEYLIPCFDKSYTFDYKDFEQRKDLKFLQLFYTDDIKKIRDTKVSTLYNFFLFNSFSMERYDAIAKILYYCKKNNLAVKQFCYIPYRTFFKYKYLLRIPLDKSLLSFSPMNREEYIDCLSKCDIVVDINHSAQTGLSMRVTETYGAGKKILTTNKSIEKDPLYNKSWAQTFDINNIELSPFEKQERNSVTDELYIDNWLKTILR